MNRQPIMLVAWQDSDVTDLIKDKSFSGKLKASNENQQPLLKTPGAADGKGTLKKKRMSKKLSIVPPENALGESLNMLGLSGLAAAAMASSEFNANLRSQRANTLKAEFSEISNHFVIGNSGAGLDGLVNKTSNNKLDQSLRISYADMVETLRTYEPPHNEQICNSNRYFETRYFPEWLNAMKFGFNILLDGVGSKKELMQRFCQLHLSNSFYVELLGYHHDFNTKNLLKNIISDVLELTDNYKTVDEQLHAINEHLRFDLFIIVHNIDGNNMREASIQNMLGELSANKHVHLVASIDHINSSLLWDNAQYLSFKWIHYETNTFQPYNDEIMFENSLMLNQSSNVQLSSIIHILKSLTQNAKNIFSVMVQHVLDPDNVKKSITFSKLYHECREKFFVSNELTLRAQLTEFIDHRLIKIKTESDGYETIFLLVDDKNLKIYLEDLKDKI